MIETVRIRVLHCIPSGSDGAPGLKVQGRQVRLAAVAADGAGQADLQLLIQAGGQPSSALAAAAKYGCVEAVRTLVAAGANINLKTGEVPPPPSSRCSCHSD